MDRRTFIGQTATGVGLLILKPETVRAYGANSAVRLGLLGCGNRGTTVATSFAKNTSARITALGDVFPDQLEKGKKHFDEVAESLSYPGVDSSLIFKGSNAGKELAQSDKIDAIQISTPVFFHVEHLAAAVAGGKHVYCEKPIAVDVAQAKHALAIGKQAQGKVSLDVGFQIRSAPPFAEMVRRIHEGALGKTAFISAHYYTAASKYPARPAMSADELRLRNWNWDRILSGDIILEQNIHVLDICNWILQGHPVKAYATGGRNVLQNAGDIWDNYQVDFTYPGDVHVSFTSRQFGEGAYFDVTEQVFGAKGFSESPYSGPLRIVGEQPWEWKDSGASPGEKQPSAFAANGAFSDNLAQADSEKEKSFVESIVSGKFHNQAEVGVESALTAMLARMAGRLGRVVTWDELLASGEKYKLGIDMKQFA